MIAIALFAIAETGVPSAPDAHNWRVDEVRQAFAEQDCQKANKIADVLIHDVTLSDDDHRELLFRMAYCDVIVGADKAAEKIFAELVHENVDYKPPFEVEDRIADRLEGARARERKVRDEAAAAERQKLKDSIKLVVHPPLNIKGGQRAPFSIDVEGATEIVKSMRIEFARAGAAENFGIPAIDQGNGKWTAEIAGFYTLSKKDTSIRYWVTASDANGPLAIAGDVQHPLVLDVARGTDLGEDVRAGERMPKFTRFVFALVGEPAITAAFFLGGETVFIGYWNATGAGDDKPGPQGGVHRVLVNDTLAWFGVGIAAVIPYAAAVAGSLVTNQILLDQPDSFIPPAVLAAAGLLYVVGTLADGPGDSLTPSIARTIGEKTPPHALYAGGYVAIAGIGLGALSLLVTPALVAIDNAKEEGFIPEDPPWVHPPAPLQPQPSEKSVR
jgi:hypothetical protein